MLQQIREALPGARDARRQVFAREVALAIVTLCTSVGPSAIPSVTAAVSLREKGISFDTPSAPWRCIARSTAAWYIFGVATFTPAISARAA